MNCAGTAEPPGSSILTVSADEFRELMGVHLGTVFATCRAAARGWSPPAAGRSSTPVLSPISAITAAPAIRRAKGAVNGSPWRSPPNCASTACGQRGVPRAATRLSTGPDYQQHIDTLRLRGMLDDLSADAALAPAPPEYVAPLYAYLAGPTSQGVTGQMFVAAGGFIGRFDRPTPRRWPTGTTASHHRGRSPK